MIHRVSQTGSTNADLAAQVTAGGPLAEGDWLIADRQLSGRGRLGRTWFDGTGNFMGSTAVRLQPGDLPAGTLALVAGLAAYEAIAPLLPPPHRAELKWPNDVLIGTAKLCGILLERVADTVIVGIGVNLAQAPSLSDRQTIAMAAFGPAPDRDAFAADVARQFDLELQRWRSYGLEPLIARWIAAAHPLGTRLTVGEPGEIALHGTFAGLTADGALQLRLADGTCRVIHAGEVRLANTM